MNKIALEFEADSALVLFEWLAERQGREVDPAADTAEGVALDWLLAALERTLVEPFMADYSDRVEQARTRLEDSLKG